MVAIERIEPENWRKEDRLSYSKVLRFRVLVDVEVDVDLVVEVWGQDETKATATAMMASGLVWDGPFKERLRRARAAARARIFSRPWYHVMSKV